MLILKLNLGQLIRVLNGQLLFILLFNYTIDH